MANNLVELDSRRDLQKTGDNVTHQFVTMRLEGQLFGLPVLLVQDILNAQTITTIPLSPPQIAGSLNLRGKIVTAINMRNTMGIGQDTSFDVKKPLSEQNVMHVVVEYNDSNYSLLVDEVGEVLNLDPRDYESNPPTLDPRWRSMSAGIYRLEKELMVVLDVEKLVNTLMEQVA